MADMVVVENNPAPVILPVPEIEPPAPVVTIPAPVRLPTALICDPDEIFPLADTNPVTYTPVLASTATLLVPETVMVIFPFAVEILILLVPLAILLDELVTVSPVRLTPLPKI